MYPILKSEWGGLITQFEEPKWCPLEIAMIWTPSLNSSLNGTM